MASGTDRQDNNKYDSTTGTKKGEGGRGLALDATPRQTGWYIEALRRGWRERGGKILRNCDTMIQKCLDMPEELLGYTGNPS